MGISFLIHALLFYFRPLFEGHDKGVGQALNVFCNFLFRNLIRFKRPTADSWRAVFLVYTRPVCVCVLPHRTFIQTRAHMSGLVNILLVGVFICHSSLPPPSKRRNN